MRVFSVKIEVTESRVLSAAGYDGAVRADANSRLVAFTRREIGGRTFFVAGRWYSLSSVEALDAWLYRTPIRGSTPDRPGDAEVVDAFLADYGKALEVQIARSAYALGTDGPRDARFDLEKQAARQYLAPPDPRRRRIRAAILFIEGYRELPLLAWPQQVLSSLVEMEQAFLVFRQRHARMVERVIGRRTGTGGSAGVDYLDQTALKYRIFGDVWAVRTILVKRSELAPVEAADLYGFAAPP